jgi:hypothetical protein
VLTVEILERENLAETIEEYGIGMRMMGVMGGGITG